MIPFRTPAEVAAAIPAVVTHLSRRGIIAYPTETIYGLGSSVSTAAVDRLSALKGRPAGKPFLLLVSAREMVAKAGLRLTDAGERLAAAFWPGPLTLVVPGGERTLPDLLRGPEGGIAVRWTSHPGASRIVSVLGAPITSTSANRPRQEPAEDGPGVEAVFRDEVAAGIGSRMSEQAVLDEAAESGAMIYTVFFETGFLRRGWIDATTFPRRRTWRGPGSLPQPSQRRQERRRQRVGARNEAAVDFLTRLADVSAGRFYNSDASNLKETFKLIAEELRHQYRLGFYPDNSTFDGQRHSLRVVVTAPGAIVRARRSYQAPRLASAS